MASAKFPGCDIINLDSDEEHVGGTVAEKVFRSGFQPDAEAMSLSVHFSPVNQSDIGDSNPCFHYLDSNSDSELVFLDPEPDPHSCFIDFFNRESYEVDRGTEFCVASNQRESTSGDSNLWSFYEMDEDIDLGIGFGSGSGSVPGSGSAQLLDEDIIEVIEIDGDSDIVNMESDSGRVESCTGLTPIGNSLFAEEEAMMVADEELEWGNLHNAINLELEPLVQVLLDASIVMEEDEGVMDIVLNGYDSIGEYSENYVIRGSPPASKRVVEDLPVVEITSEELCDGNIVCAICKDDVVVEEKVNRLPCRHYYHGECIIPWLGIRTTCPVCRYELPTDDVEYERNRGTQRRSLVTNLM